MTREEEDEILAQAGRILSHRLRLAECDLVVLEVRRGSVKASVWRGPSCLARRGDAGLAGAVAAIDDAAATRRR